MPRQSKPPIYKPGKRAGYDPKRRHYYTADGSLVSKNYFNAMQEAPMPGEGEGRYGFYTEIDRAPESRQWELVERMVAAGDRGEDLTKHPLLRQAGDNLNFIAGFVKPDTMPVGVKAEPIPGAIRAAYNLVDYYYERSGDVAQSVETPVDLSLQPGPLKIEGPYKSELEARYGKNGVDMSHVLFQIFYSAAKYGVAYPYEIYEGKDPKRLVLLPPRYVWVGYHATQSWLFEKAGRPLEAPPINDAAYALRPLDGASVWNELLMETAIKPVSYGPVADQWRNQNPGGTSWGLPVPLEFLDPVRAKSLDYERYPSPAISRAFTNLSTRLAFHEMRRAVLEGHKNQLWFFTIGEKDRPPGADEMLAFKAAIAGLSGHRTGNLVWRFGAEAKVIAPNALQGMMANETAVLFDLAVARDLGMSLRLMTGNPAGVTGSGGGEGLEIDLSVLLRRLEFARAKVLDWELGYRLRMAKRLGGASAVKAAEKTKVTFSESLLEIGERVKKEVQPMYMMGLYSPQTSLERTGGSYDGEVEKKKAHKPNEELFLPTPTYNQTATGQGGQQTTSKTAPQGRPASNVSPAKLKASWEEDDQRLAHVTDVLTAYAEFVKTGDADGFVARFHALNDQHLMAAAQKGYVTAGGLGQLDDDCLGAACHFVNAYLPGLQAALKTADKRDDAKMIARVLMYPQEGYKMAVLNGQNRAMRERGATNWKRIVKASGCVACQADAQLLHSIDEPFQVLHPNEDCPGGELYLQYFIGGLPSIEIPTPGSRGDYAELVDQILGKAGDHSRRRRK